MAYDLFLAPAEPSRRGGEPPVTAAALRAWLTARPHYRTAAEPGPTGAAAVHYADGDTGVTFAVDLAPAGPVPPESAAHDDPTIAAVGVDLLVPAFFAETAAAELAALAGAFPLTFDDPQSGSRGAFDAGGFLDTWRTTAELAARHAAAKGRPLPTAPAESLNAAHAWNAARAKWRKHMPDDGPGVPRVQLRQTQTDCGKPVVRTWCAWVDAAPIVLPPVDDVLLVRDALRPRQLLFFKSAEASLSLVPRERAATAPGSGPAPERFPPGSRQILAPTAETVHWFKSLPPTPPRPTPSRPGP